jgi:hypothetical protein
VRAVLVDRDDDVVGGGEGLVDHLEDRLVAAVAAAEETRHHERRPRRCRRRGEGHADGRERGRIHPFRHPQPDRLRPLEHVAEDRAVAGRAGERLDAGHGEGVHPPEVGPRRVRREVGAGVGGEQRHAPRGQPGHHGAGIAQVLEHPEHRGQLHAVEPCGGEGLHVEVDHPRAGVPRDDVHRQVERRREEPFHRHAAAADVDDAQPRPHEAGREAATQIPVARQSIRVGPAGEIGRRGCHRRDLIARVSCSESAFRLTVRHARPFRPVIE